MIALQSGGSVHSLRRAGRGGGRGWKGGRGMGRRGQRGRISYLSKCSRVVHICVTRCRTRKDNITIWGVGREGGRFGGEEEREGGTERELPTFRSVHGLYTSVWLYVELVMTTLQSGGLVHATASKMLFIHIIQHYKRRKGERLKKWCNCWWFVYDYIYPRYY